MAKRVWTHMQREIDASCGPERHCVNVQLITRIGIILRISPNTIEQMQMLIEPGLNTVLPGDRGKTVPLICCSMQEIDFLLGHGPVEYFAKLQVHHHGRFANLQNMAGRYILVVALYKAQVVAYQRALRQMVKDRQLSEDDSARIKVKTIDDAQGDEADFVFVDFVTTSHQGFTGKDFRLTLGTTRARGISIFLLNRGSFVGYDDPRDLEKQRMVIKLYEAYNWIVNGADNQESHHDNAWEILVGKRWHVRDADEETKADGNEEGGDDQNKQMAVKKVDDKDNISISKRLRNEFDDQPLAKKPCANCDPIQTRDDTVDVKM
ncbi:hypothetical protein HJFPF1_06791 [Paramyrothecium foliicola]|nr:hypothetical protein HJFPF1_06791 [Paramyrothecium foliicola]